MDAIITQLQDLFDGQIVCVQRNPNPNLGPL